MKELGAATISDFSDYGDGEYSPYEEYKITDINWLSNIPENWETTRLKNIFDVKNGSTPKSTEDSYWEGDIAWATPDDLQEETEDIITETKRQLTEEGLAACGATLVPEGSILLSSRAPIGHLGVAGVKITTNQGCKSLVFKEDSHNEMYFYYFLIASAQELKSLGSGSTYDELNSRHLKSVEVTIPPREDQEEIVEFLNHETEKTDELIHKKERLVKLLEEKRAAIINNLVTSGINNSEQQTVDLDWFESIPEDWVTTSLRNTVDKFVDYRGATPEKSDSGITLITAKNIDNGKLDFSENQEYVTEDVYEDWMTRGIPEEGDVLITTEAPMGEVAQIQETPVALAQRIILLKVNTDLLKKDFLKYYLNSEFNQTQLMKNQTGSTAKGIQASKLKGIRVFIPPLSEQKIILEKIEEETQKIDNLISQVEQVIEHLKEYRTALITEAATGQIDIRGEV